MKKNKGKFEVQSTTRQVIEHKLLTALEDGATVAILASERDLKDIIAALHGLACAPNSPLRERRKSLADGLTQLLLEAFPPK